MRRFPSAVLARSLRCCEPRARVRFRGMYNRKHSHRDLPMKNGYVMQVFGSAAAPPVVGKHGEG